MELQQDLDLTADAIYRDKVLRARATDPVERLLDGFRLFDEALTFTKAGVMEQLGTSDETMVMAEVERRIERIRKLQDFGYYKPWTPQVRTS
ncbi:MAG: hypothetical protein ACKV19_04710 [Verrucomicrobiales bacterium]